MRIGRRGGVLLALTAGSALLAGCGSSPMPTPSPTPSYTSDYVEPAPVALAPLTGETVPVGALGTPSLAAKVDNHPDARPQVGLERADLVVEELVEGGLTRYVAVWHSDVPAEIGPIRSIRPMDPDIISPFGGIVAYSGGQYRFVEMMRATNVYNAIHGQRDTDDLMFRTPDKPGPHDVLVRAPQLIAAHADLAPPPQQFAFAEGLLSSSPVREGEYVRSLDLRFSTASQRGWTWNGVRGVFERSQDGVVDRDPRGVPYSAVNVVVIRVPVTVSQQIPKTELIGSGEAWVASGGRLLHATWSKGSATKPLRLVDDTGAVVRLAPGNSWIELVPLGGSASFEFPPTAG